MMLSLNNSLLEEPCTAKARVKSTPCGLLEVGSPRKNAPGHVLSFVRSKQLTETAGSSRSSRIEPSSLVCSEPRQLAARPNHPCYSFLRGQDSERSPGKFDYRPLLSNF